MSPKVFVRSKGERVTVQQQRQMHERKPKVEPTAEPEPVYESAPAPAKRPTLAEPCTCGGMALNGGAEDGWRCLSCGRSISADDPRMTGKRVR